MPNAKNEKIKLTAGDINALISAANLFQRLFPPFKNGDLITPSQMRETLAKLYEQSQLPAMGDDVHAMKRSLESIKRVTDKMKQVEVKFV